MAKTTSKYLLRGLFAAALVATFVCLKVYNDREIYRAASEFPPVGQFVTVEGVRLHYLSKGAGNPVVLIHGSDGVLQDFTLTIFDKLAKNYRTIAFDRPGHGYSQRPMNELLTLATNARLIHSALRQLGVKKAVLVGHSYGGSVALKYALEYPEDVAGIVLIAPAAYALGITSFIFSVPDIPLLGPLALQTLLVPVGRPAVRSLNTRSFEPDPVPVADEKTMEAFLLRPQQFKAFADEIKILDRGLREQSPRYSEIRVPVVIVAGDSDQVTKPVNHAFPLHNAIPHSKLMIAENTGHEILYKHPEIVLDAIRRAWDH